MKLKINYFLILFFPFINFNFLDKAFAETAKFPSIITNDHGQYVYDLWIKNDSSNDIVQINSSSDYGVNWNRAISLSQTNKNAKMASFVTDIKEKNIYAVWVRSNGINDLIEFSYSFNYAKTWIMPKNLSDIGQNAKNPQLITNFIGDHVYVIWQRFNGANDIIQFSGSDNFGHTFSRPQDLSEAGQNAKNPKILTNLNENCIYAVWARSNGTNDIIQFKLSLDYGKTWGDTLDLSDREKNAKNPEIVTNGSSIYTVFSIQKNSTYLAQFCKSIDNGKTFSEALDLSSDVFSVDKAKIVMSNDAKYIYVCWDTFDGMFRDVHVVFSKNSGNKFSAPYVLNRYGRNCKDIDMVTDKNGKNTYVVWVRSNGVNDVVQLGKSNDYGATWTTFGLDLSFSNQDAKNPKITISPSGKDIYVTWAGSDGRNEVIQMVFSNDYGATFSVPKIISN